MSTPLIALEYDKWVDEGNNYAGFSGYRVHKTFFFSMEELDAWLLDRSHMILGERKEIMLRHIYVSLIEDKMDLAFVMRDLAFKKKKAELARSEKEAEEELAKAQRKLEEVRAAQK